MKEGESRPASEIVSWVSLGLTFPLYAALLEPLRKDTLEGLEEMIGDKPLPVVTVFFAGLPEHLILPGALLGIFVAACGIVAGRFLWFRRHRVAVITMGWMFSFLLFALLILSLLIPYLSVTYGVWGDLPKAI